MSSGSPVDAMGGAALHALQHLGELGRNMNASQDVHVRRHHAELQNARAVLQCNSGQLLPEEGGTCEVDARLSIASGPHDMNQKSMMHAPEWTYPRMTRTHFQRSREPIRRERPLGRRRRFSDVLRADALASSACRADAVTSRSESDSP